MTKEEKKLHNAAVATMTTEEGKTLMEEIADFCGEGKDIFTRSIDDRACAYLLGRQSVLLRIRELLKGDEE